MIERLDRTVKALQRRVLLNRWVLALRTHAIFGLLLVGAVILVLRSAAEMPRATAALAVLGLLLAPLTAWWVARRSRLSATGAAAWLDLHSGGDGSIVTALEREDPRWSERVEHVLSSQPALPAAALEGSAARTLPAVAFLALALWVEMPRSQHAMNVELFEGMATALEEKLETLEEVAELDPESSEELRDRLEQLEVEALEGTPESFFEAADSLEASLEETATELAQKASDLEQKVTAAADAELEEQAEGIMRESLSELSDMGFTEGLSRELEESLELSEGLELDSELMSQLSEEMRELLKEKLEGLEKSGLVDASKLRKIDPSQLARMQKAAAKLGKPCSCEECKKAGKKTNSENCDGEGACHKAECMEAGYCVGGGT